MCKAMEDLYKEGVSKGRIEGKIEGKAEGKIEGKIEGICEFVRDGIISTAQGAFRAKLSEAEFKEVMEKYGYQPS